MYDERMRMRSGARRSARAARRCPRKTRTPHKGCGEEKQEPHTKDVGKKPKISHHCENRSVLKRLRLESSHCENTIHEEGRGGGGGGGEGGEEMQQTRPRLESSHVNTECVRKEEEEEEEEKEEERKEEGGRSWRCARKTRTPHKGCGE